MFTHKQPMLLQLQATATDLCSGPLIDWSHDYVVGDLSDECGATGSVDVIFTATDECTRSVDTNAATFAIEDTTAPTITTPASDTTVECDGNGNTNQLTDWLNANGGVRRNGAGGSIFFFADTILAGRRIGCVWICDVDKQQRQRDADAQLRRHWHTCVDVYGNGLMHAVLGNAGNVYH